MYYLLRKLQMLVLLLLHFTSLSDGAIKYTVRLYPYYLLVDMCVVVHVDIQYNGIKPVSSEGIITYKIRTRDMEWNFKSYKSSLTFGLIVKNATHPKIFVEAARANEPYTKAGVAFGTFPGRDLYNFTLELFDQNKIEGSKVLINSEISMRINYKARTDYEYFFRYVTYWYEDCIHLYSLERNKVTRAFTEPFKIYEIVVAIEVVYNGETTYDSPYNCDGDILTPPPTYYPQTMIGPSGDNLFQCDLKRQFSGRAVTKRTVIAIDPTPFTNGTISLYQDNDNRTNIVTTKDEVNINLVLDGDDKKRFEKSANNSIYWYGNCELLAITEATELTRTFNDHGPYEIVAVITAYYEGSDPYDCLNGKLQLENELCAAGVFRKPFEVRETLITNATLSIVQKAKIKDFIVAINDSTIMTLSLEAKDAEHFNEVESKTFWYQNCTLLGTSADRTFKHRFMETETEYNVTAVIVITHNGSSPTDPPYLCFNDTLIIDFDHAVGAFHKVLYSRDILIPEGAVELIQNETKKYFVAQNEPFNLSVKLTDHGQEILGRTKDAKTYWFADCEFLFSTTANKSYEYVFEKPFHHYNIVGVVMGMYNGTPPAIPPYDCLTDTINEDLSYAIGAFVTEYFTRVFFLNSSFGHVVLEQSGYTRKNVVGPNDPFGLSIKLDEIYDDVSENVKTNKMFWYSNCTLLGNTIKPSFETTFDEAFQTYKVVGVLVAVYNETPPIDPPYDCETNTLIEDVDYAVGVFNASYFTRVIRLNTTYAEIVLEQDGLVRITYVDTEEPFHLNIELDKDYDDLIEKAHNVQSFWYINCKFVGNSPNASFQYKWDEPFQTYEIDAVFVLTHNGTPPVDAPYDCANDTIDEDEDHSVGVFHKEYITRATKLDDGPLNILQNGHTRVDTVATDVLNMSLRLTESHRRALDHSNSFTVFWHRDCALIGQTNDTTALAIFRKPYRIYELVGVLVAAHEGLPPVKSPYICKNKTVHLDIKYTMATFTGTIITKEPIRNLKVKGKTTFKETEVLKLQVSYTGTPPFEYCLWIFDEMYVKTNEEDCQRPALQSLYNEGSKSIYQAAVNSDNNKFDYQNKFDAGKYMLGFVIKNEVSKEVTLVPIHALKVLVAYLKCLGGCN